MANAGDIREFSVQSDGRSYVFTPKSGEEVSVLNGGWMCSDDRANIGVNGVRLKVYTRMPWEVSLTIIAEESSHQDIQDLMEALTDGTYIFQYSDGSYWTGKGSPVGENQRNVYAGTIPVKIMGSGRLTQM